MLYDAAQVLPFMIGNATGYQYDDTCGVATGHHTETAAVHEAATKHPCGWTEEAEPLYAVWAYEETPPLRPTAVVRRTQEDQLRHLPDRYTGIVYMTGSHTT